MILSAVIPVYNEQATIREIYECLKAADSEKGIIIVDDGSTEASREILQGLAADIIVKSVHRSQIDRSACDGM